MFLVNISGCAQHWHAEIRDLQRESTVNHAIAACQVAMELDLTAVNKQHAFDDVMDQVMFKTRLQLDLLILQNVLQTAFLTILSEYELLVRLQTNANKSSDMIVLQVLDLFHFE